MNKNDHLKQISCLDDKGFVRLVDYMGNDQRIVQAARVSYGDGTKSKRQDRGLINYLMRNQHTSPFEMVEFTFHCKLPLFLARQFIRHRTANVNEISGRYSVIRDEFYIPEADQYRSQHATNKQMSGDFLSPEMGEVSKQRIEKVCKDNYDTYEMLLSEGELAREMARMVLPVNVYTEWYWKIDLHNLLHFIRLRIDSHAQYEAQIYAQAFLDLIKDIVPYTVQAWENHIRRSQRFSLEEISSIRQALQTLDEDQLSSIIQQAPELKRFFNGTS